MNIVCKCFQPYSATAPHNLLLSPAQNPQTGLFVIQFAGRLTVSEHLRRFQLSMQGLPSFPRV